MRIDSPSRQYRVTTDNNVLNYYRTRDEAAKCMRVLKRFSPETFAEAYIEKRDSDDPYVYHRLSSLCYTV